MTMLAEAVPHAPIATAVDMLSPFDELVFPQHRRAVLQRATNSTGAPELRIFYGDKEISFDEPQFFGFAEHLVAQSRFRAGDVQHWSPECSWPQLRAVLQQLLDAGILMPASVIAPAAQSAGKVGSPLPPATCPMARGWDACEAITQDLAGRAVEPGYLELIVPIFRVAHTARDADGRQVGEANVFPPALRMDVPTEWRRCDLPGTRFQSDRPMNVTAMRVMRAHWPQMMAAIGRVRSVFLQRFPEAEGNWTVGHLERLATTVLAVPTYQLMRAERPVPNGALHPALSSLFRVTDGVRMVMHQMLFVPIGEPAWSPSDPVSVEGILDYAERNYSYHSQHGVCAGPRPLVAELVRTLLEGGEHAEFPFDPAVAQALADAPAAMDYAMRGLQAYAAVFSLWPAMTRCYTRLADIAEGWTATTPAVAMLTARLVARRDTIATGTYLAHEHWRASRDDAYADMFGAAGRGVAGATPPAALPTLLQPRWSTQAEAARGQLVQVFLDRFGLDWVAAGAFVDVVMDWLLRAQAILQTAADVQAAINRGLGRAAPRRRLSLADIDVHNQMQGPNPQRLPFLLDEIEALLGIAIELDTERCAIGV